MVDRRLVREMRPYRRACLMVCGGYLGSAACTVLFAYYLATVMQLVIFAGMNLSEVVPQFAVLLFVVLGRALCRWFIDVTAYEIAAAIQEDLRQRLLRQFCFVMGPVRLTDEKSGVLLSCVEDAVAALEGFFAKFLPLVTAAVIIPLCILAVAIPEDFFTGLFFFVTAPLIPLFMFLIGRQAESANRRQWKVLTRLSGEFLDLLEGLTTLKLFNQSRRQGEALANLNDSFRQATMQVLRVAFLSSFVLELTATLSVAIVAVSVGLRLLAGDMIFGQALFLLLLAPEFYQPLRNLGSAFHQAIASSVAAEQIYAFLQQAPDLPIEGMADLGTGAVTVEFRGVSYAYDGKAALQELSFTVAAGCYTAIVGASGAGKSTILRLLLGFVRPSGGEIKLNGRAIASLSRHAHYRGLAYLPQQPHIFSLSAAQNIALGKPDAPLEEIIAAARAAEIHDFIAALPDGYATVLGDSGRQLSGGQCQRIALARVLLQEAGLVLLDEGFAALDAVTGRRIRQALLLRAGGRTLLTITHHLPEAAKADQIIVLHEGRAVESGAHDELMARRGHYYALWQAGTEVRVDVV